MPRALQILLMSQCLLQALLVTMLARTAVLVRRPFGGLTPAPDEPQTWALTVVARTCRSLWSRGVCVAAQELGPPLGLLTVVLTFLPTLLMSKIFTPRVLKHLALATAAATEQHSVLEEIENELERSGDYAGASQVCAIGLFLGGASLYFVGKIHSIGSLYAALSVFGVAQALTVVLETDPGTC